VAPASSRRALRKFGVTVGLAFVAPALLRSHWVRRKIEPVDRTRSEQQF